MNWEERQRAKKKQNYDILAEVEAAWRRIIHQYGRNMYCSNKFYDILINRWTSKILSECDLERLQFGLQPTSPTVITYHYRHVSARHTAIKITIIQIVVQLVAIACINTIWFGLWIVSFVTKMFCSRRNVSNICNGCDSMILWVQ